MTEGFIKIFWINIGNTINFVFPNVEIDAWRLGNKVCFCKCCISYSNWEYWEIWTIALILLFSHPHKVIQIFSFISLNVYKEYPLSEKKLFSVKSYLKWRVSHYVETKWSVSYRNCELYMQNFVKVLGFLLMMSVSSDNHNNVHRYKKHSQKTTVYNSNIVCNKIPHLYNVWTLATQCV